MNELRDNVKLMAKKVVELVKFFEVFLRGDNFVEVRLLKTKKGTISGYFNDKDKLLNAVRKYDGAYNVFFTLNEINPDIAARSANHMTEWAKNTTTDAEITRRKWILIDLDPERPAGISATDEELERAKSLSDEVVQFLRERKFPEPVQAMSGNGHHLLLPVDLPNDKDTAMLVKQFLESLHDKFSNEHVKVDTSTYNAARITKLYGTVACKGDSTETRPHRRSEILSIPEAITPATREQLKRLIPEKQEPAKQQSKAPLSKKQEKSKGRPQAAYNKIDVKEYCEFHKFEIAREKECMGGTCYVLANCPWNPEHTDQSAYIIQFQNGKIVASCHHDSCHHENWKSLLQKYPYQINKGEKIEKKLPLEGTEGMGAAELLMAEINEAGHKFYHDKSEKAYAAVIQSSGHTEYMDIQGTYYRQLLRRTHYERYGKPLNKDALQQVLDTLESQAVYDGEEIEMSIRCKCVGDMIYYHLADPEQTVISVSENGIKALESSPVPFLKSKNMLEQALPVDRTETEEDPGAGFRNTGREYWKFSDEDDELLHHVVLLTRFISDIPAPILYYRGDRGAAKTTSMRFDKMLVDPSSTDIKALPSAINDIVAALSGQYMVGFDNLEGKLSAEVSNLLCVCASGGYYSKRKLYTDNDTADVKLKAKLSFSGITTITDRADFLDRCVCLSPQRLTAAERKPEKELLDNFQRDLPYLLHCSMKVLSKAIAIRKNMGPLNLPRMADFAQWGYAIAEAMAYGGDQFLQAYQKNQDELLCSMAEEDTILTILIAFMKDQKHFKGSTSKLYALLSQQAQRMGVSTQYGWCKSVQGLGRKLSQSKSVLEGFHIFMDTGKSNGDRYREIWYEVDSLKKIDDGDDGAE